MQRHYIDPLPRDTDQCSDIILTPSFGTLAGAVADCIGVLHSIVSREGQKMFPSCPPNQSFISGSVETLARK